MTIVRQLLPAGILGLALVSSGAIGHCFAQTITVPPVPDNLRVPDGNIAFLKGSAEGTQNYICLPSGSGFSYTLFTPQATLFLTLPWFRGEIKQQITTHFFSPNPEEKDTIRAAWQSSLDSSSVWAKLVQPSNDPRFVAPGAIAWLLLEKAGTRNGPTGGTILAQTTFIQRLTTAGGLAPSTGCSQPSDVGKPAFVPYTADYFFYRRSPGTL